MILLDKSIYAYRYSCIVNPNIINSPNASNNGGIPSHQLGRGLGLGLGLGLSIHVKASSVP
jgi:hypothetical protein